MLQARSVGQIISDSADVLRQNFWLFTIAVFPFCVVEFFLREGISLLTAKMMTLLDPEKIEVSGEVPFDALLNGAAVLPSLLACELVIYTLISAISIVGSARLYQELKTTRLHLWSGALNRLVPIIFTTLIVAVVMLILVLVPLFFGSGILAFLQGSPRLGLGLALGVGFIVTLLVGLLGLWLLLTWSLGTTAIVLEDSGYIKALKRSAELLHSRGLRFTEYPKLRLGGLLLLNLIIGSTLQAVFIIPSLINGISQNPPMSDMSVLSLSLPVAIVVALGQILSNAILYPFSAITMTHFYYDLRIRFEGFDSEDLRAS